MNAPPRAKTLTIIAALLVVARAAGAQTPPVPPADVPAAAAPAAPAVEWKTQAKGGFLFTSGNSQTTNGTFGVTTSRKEGGNKLAFEGMIAYGRSNVLVPVFGDATMPSLITDLDRQEIETTNMWTTKGRYDRFLTPNNAAFGAGLASADKIAGKSLVGGVQVGYSRQLLKNDVHLLVAEIGYDFSHERYVQQPMRMVEPISIHSGRVYVAETLKVTNDTGVTGSVEALFNLNREGSAVNHNTRQLGVDAFKDTRVVGKLGFTTTFWKALSIGLGFTLRYDQNPAPRPIPSGAPAGSAYACATGEAACFFANQTDLLGEATLIYTFL